MPRILLYLSAIVLVFSRVLARDAFYSEPLQVLSAGQKLTAGETTLFLGSDCTLAIYEKDKLVFDFNTTVHTSYCTLILENSGRLLLIADSEATPLGVIGEQTNQGRYALLLTEESLTIYGPALWTNGVGWYQGGSATADRIQLKSGMLASSGKEVSKLIYSGEEIIADPNEDVTVAVYGEFAAILRPSCSLAIIRGEVRVWETETNGEAQGQCQLKLKDDGELVLKDVAAPVNASVPDSGEKTLWSSGYSSITNKYVGILRYDGQFVIYGVKDQVYGGEEVEGMKIIK